MDASTNELVAVIGAVGSVVLAPIFTLATLWLNQKFNAEVLTLKADRDALSERVKACEERHAKLDASQAAASPK